VLNIETKLGGSATKGPLNLREPRFSSKIFVSKKGLNMCKCFSAMGQLVHFELRNYPRPFGDAIVRLRDDLVKGRAFCKSPYPLPSGVSSVDASGAHDCLFASARLPEVVKYLRLGKNLDLETHWRDKITVPLEIEGH